MARKLIRIDTSLVNHSNDPSFIKACHLLDSNYEKYLIEAKEILRGNTLVREVNGLRLSFYKQGNYACYDIVDVKEPREIISYSKTKLSWFPTQNRLETVIQSIAIGEATALTHPNN